MARRARCESVKAKEYDKYGNPAPKVNDVLRDEGAMMLNNLLEKVVIYLEHTRGRIINEGHVNDALKYLNVKTET